MENYKQQYCSQNQFHVPDNVGSHDMMQLFKLLKAQQLPRMQITHIITHTISTPTPTPAPAPVPVPFPVPGSSWGSQGMAASGSTEDINTCCQRR